MSTRVTRIIEDDSGSHLEVQRVRLSVRGPQGEVGPLELSGEVIDIGSSESSDLVVDDPSVSRHHARIELRSDGILLRDLGSTNGTWIGGLRIGKAYLPERTTIQVGESQVFFELSGETDRLRLSSQGFFGSILGTSTAMRRVFAELEQIAPTDATILVQGESGTGKELVAEALHKGSARSSKPLVVVDCGALPRNLIESELFGHEKGAFTGAIGARPGAFEVADGGTLFLDEIGELDVELQPRLLRALDQRRVKRVGGSDYRDVNVRLVAATHRDLEKMITEGSFREDLFFRLSVIRVRLPPLRDRTEDIPLLAESFLEDLRASNPHGSPMELGEDKMQELMSRSWPGNVRELRNVIERMVLLGGLDDRGMERPRTPTAPGSGFAIPHSMPYAMAREAWLDTFEREYIGKALSGADFNASRAARQASMDRSTLVRLMRKHELGKSGGSGS